MKSNKSLLSALLGAALLAMPITAAAKDHGPQRNFTPAYRQAPAFHPAPAPRANLAPRVAANNRVWMAPASPIVQVHDRDDWRWRHHEEGWKHRDRDDWRWNDHDRDDGWRYRRDRDDYCNRPPYGNNLYYRQGYRPYYYQPDSYNYETPYYGGGSGVAMLMQQRDNAVVQYQLAMRNGNPVRARYIGKEIDNLNKRIANQRGRGYGYSGYSAFNSPYADNYGYGSGYNNYGYGSGYGNGNSSLDALVGPLLGNYIH